MIARETGNEEAAAGPPISEWSPETAALHDVIDVLLMLRRELWQLARQKPPPYQPVPRPWTAVDRARSARRLRDREDLRRRLFPGGGG